jgi:hypothetical protein
MYDNSSPEIAKAHIEAQKLVIQQLAGFGNEAIPRFLQAMAFAKDGIAHGVDLRPLLKSRFEEGELAKSNSVARQLRNRSPREQSFNSKFPSWRKDLSASQIEKAIAKSALDVGSQTNLANVTGGQSLGLVSMDTRMARGTVRPKSFTLYHHLNKTIAWQIVDYWPYASDVGGGLPGTAYSAFSSQTSGSLSPNSGSYGLKYLNLKLAVDPRAITMSLAQQNSFVNVAEQESTNAALNILTSVEWSIYWGSPTLYPNQPQGIASLIPTTNIVDFYSYYQSAPVQALGVSQPQALFNLIYETSAHIVGWRQYGQITHAFMTPVAIADLQTITTGVLRTIANDVTDFQHGSRAIVIDGELRGMNTSFGDIAFALDFFISARDVPAQAQLREADHTDFTVAALPAPTSVTLGLVASGTTNALGSEFTGLFSPTTGSNGNYYYAVASADSYMNESQLAFSTQIAGVVAYDAVSVTIVPGTGSVAAGVAAFRVFRSGIGFAGTPATWTNATNPNGTVANPAAFRYIGSIAANGANSVVFYDLNTHIPGSEYLFLLDLDDEDDAFDYRTMLPISKIELFANNLFMPWAVAHIGAARLRIPKFHGMIKNYTAMSPDWSATSTNAAANPLGY